MPVCSVLAAWNRGKILAEGQNLARSLMEAPANVMTPTRFAEIASEKLGPLDNITVRARCDTLKFRVSVWVWCVCTYNMESKQHWNTFTVYLHWLKQLLLSTCLASLLNVSTCRAFIAHCFVLDIGTETGLRKRKCTATWACHVAQRNRPSFLRLSTEAPVLMTRL